MHIAVTCDGLTMRLYLDGRLFQTASLPGTIEFNVGDNAQGEGQ